MAYGVPGTGVNGIAWSPDGKRIAFLLLGRYDTDTHGRITATDFQPGQPFELYLGIRDMSAGQPMHASWLCSSRPRSGWPSRFGDG